eukprot:evm.model.scf_2875.1 EVM.evm.TU.scf_2875.1   scf_2875:3124-7815(-)
MLTVIQQSALPTGQPPRACGAAAAFWGGRGASIDELESEDGGGRAWGEREWDVVALGQAMVDIAANVDEGTLAKLGVGKGSRRVVGLEECWEMRRSLGGGYDVRQGCSLANTLVTLARLSAADGGWGGAGLRVAFGGAIGSDPTGEFFESQLRKAGVEVLSGGGGQTGSVLVLTTADAQRSFLAYPGTSRLCLESRLEAAASSSRVLLLEGYVLELPDGLEFAHRALRIARAGGALVGLTAGDPGLVARHREEMAGLMAAGLDMLFTNHAEAAALIGEEEGGISAKDAAARLAKDCPFVVVTDGSHGSVIRVPGAVAEVPPCWVTDAPVDTCGAGDVYMGGLLYGFFRGMDLRGIGRVAARAASQIICRQGSALTDEEAAGVAASVAAEESNERGAAAIQCKVNVDKEKTHACPWLSVSYLVSSVRAVMAMALAEEPAAAQVGGQGGGAPSGGRLRPILSRSALPGDGQRSGSEGREPDGDVCLFAARLAHVGVCAEAGPVGWFILGRSAILVLELGAMRVEMEAEAKGVSLFEEEWLSAPFGTIDKPVQVTSFNTERIVGVPDPDDDSIVVWGIIRENEPPKQLVENGEYFILKKMDPDEWNKDH